MIRFSYSLLSTGISLFWRISAFLANEKSKKAIDGRRNWEEKLRFLGFKNQPIWIHASSHGEGLMAKPIIEELIENTKYEILISFFSPSGYENFSYKNERIKKFYLPLDYKSNSRKFIKTINPKLLIFVKYDFWMNHIIEAQNNDIPTFAFSVNLRSNHWYFSWYSSLAREVLKKMKVILTLNNETIKNLANAGLTNTKLCGDTRYDQVNTIQDFNLFKVSKPCILLGSSWEEEEKMVSSIYKEFPHVQFIIAPHDISSNRITYIQQLFNEESALLSNGNLDDLPPVLIIDKIGILAELYSISDIAIIGGGFKDKLHNIIEPAAKGNYILFGPKHSRYPEASEMINANIADSFFNQTELKTKIRTAIGNSDVLDDYKQKSTNFSKEKKGATELVYQEIKNYL